MKAILTVAVLLGTAASAPAWAGEGPGYPTDSPVPAISSTMTMTQGGLDDPYKWSAKPTASQYSVVTGGMDDPYKWSAAPTPAAPARQAAESRPNGHS